MITYKLVKVQNGKELSSVTLTDEEIDAIFSAMGDYQDYGDEESEISSSLTDKISSL